MPCMSCMVPKKFVNHTRHISEDEIHCLFIVVKGEGLLCGYFTRELIQDALPGYFIQLHPVTAKLRRHLPGEIFLPHLF